jgi:hypothetical protein
MNEEYCLKLLAKRSIDIYSPSQRFEYVHYQKLWPKTYKKLEYHGYVKLDYVWGPTLTESGREYLERLMALEALAG